MSDGDSLAWQHINQRCGNKDCIYCRFRDAEARIATLEADRNAWRECAERLGRQVARITQLESDNSTIVEDAAMVADENKRLRRIAEAAVRYLTHQDYDGLLNALRAEGYMGATE